jgi:hypothetical protein
VAADRPRVDNRWTLKHHAFVLVVVLRTTGGHRCRRYDGQAVRVANVYRFAVARGV